MPGWIDLDELRQPHEPVRPGGPPTDEALARLGELAQQVAPQVTGLAAAAEELSTRLDRLGEDGDVEELRAALVRIEKTVEALADTQIRDDDVGDTLAQLGASLSVLAEVSMPSRFHQLNQTLTDSDQERRRDLESLRAGFGQFQDAWEARTREEETARLVLTDRLDRVVDALATRAGSDEEAAGAALSERLDDLTRAIEARNQLEEQALHSVYGRFDRVNDAVAALAHQDEHERLAIETRLDRVNEALAGIAQDGQDQADSLLTSFRQLNQVLAGIANDGQLERDTLRTAIDRINRTLAGIAQDGQQARESVTAGLGQVDQTLAGLAQDGQQARESVTAGLDRINQTLAGLAQDAEQDRDARHDGLDQLKQVWAAALAEQTQQERLFLHAAFSQLKEDWGTTLAQQGERERLFLQSRLDQLKQEWSAALADQVEGQRHFLHSDFDQLRQDWTTAAGHDGDARFEQISRAVTAAIAEERRQVTDRLDRLIAEVERLRRRVALRGRPAPTDRDPATPMARPADRPTPNSRAPRPLRAAGRSGTNQSSPGDSQTAQPW